MLWPGGYLLYADYRDREQVELWRGQIAAAGFRVQDERSITPNVVRALDLDHDRRLALIKCSTSQFRSGALYYARRGSGIGDM